MALRASAALDFVRAHKEPLIGVVQARSSASLDETEWLLWSLQVLALLLWLL